MNISSLFIWSLLNFITVILLGFYSMMEMAAVSFSKVRLQYYVSHGVKQAIWLEYLLDNPARLFGTTLILVNIALTSGSEFARQSYEAIGINPDFSPLTQVFLVVIFGELAPMFAARRYPEHVAMLGTSIVYFTAKLMTPFLWILGIISKACNMLVGGQEVETKIFLNQEELLKILELEDDGKTFSSESQEYDTVAAHILKLYKIKAKDIIKPLETNFMISANATVSQVRKQFDKTESPHLIMYAQDIKNIIGVLFPRDLIRVEDQKKARVYAKEPWFITESTTILDLLNQFRTNNESVAIVLNSKGKSLGVINLDDVMEAIFGEARGRSENNAQLLVERSFPATLTLSEFQELYDIVLDPRLELTLEELMKEHLGSHPEVGDFIFIDPFEISVKDTTLTGIKTVGIRTRIK